MKTPIYDFLLQYTEKKPVRMHMPGHKGRFGPPLLQTAAELDLTEIPGADSLFEADGIIAESEKNAAALYGTAYTFYSCAGSTLCIQTMLLLMKQEGRAVIAARNVHRAFLNACVLLDLPVQWVYPRSSDSILSGVYAPEDFAAALEQLRRPACIYITSPDYLGHKADIGALAEICQKYHAKLPVPIWHFCRSTNIPFSWGQIIAVTLPTRCCLALRERRTSTCAMSWTLHRNGCGAQWQCLLLPAHPISSWPRWTGATGNWLHRCFGNSCCLWQTSFRN